MQPEKAEKFTLHLLRLWLRLLNVQYDPRKLCCTVTWKIIDTSTFTNIVISFQRWIPEEIFGMTWHRRFSWIPTFCPFCRASHYEILENLSFRFEKQLASRSLVYISGSVTSHTLRKSFSELLQLLRENLQHSQKRMNRVRLYVVNLTTNLTKAIKQGNRLH